MMHYPDLVIEFLHLFSSNLVEMTTSSSRAFWMEAAAFGGLSPSYIPSPFLSYATAIPSTGAEESPC